MRNLTVSPFATPSRTRRLAIAVVGLCVISVAPSLAAQSSAPLKAFPTPDSLAAISIRGRLLWEYDVVAWITTDSIEARHPTAGAITSYVARQRGDLWDVAYGRLSTARDTFYVAYEARQRQDTPESFDVDVVSPARADTGYYMRAARAMAVARADFGEQGRPYNAAVIERPNGMLWVYLMPAQLRSDVYPLGGDVRYLFPADGRAFVAKRRLHKAIMEHAPLAAGASKPVAGMHAAILDDIPEDTDVFHVLARRPSLPEYVVTESFSYFIAPNGAIRVSRRKQTDVDSTKTEKLP